MFAGEFVATKSQNEVLRGEIDLERRHIQTNRLDIVSEVSSLLDLIGISNQQETMKEEILTFYDNNPEAPLKLVVALEFGVIEEEQRSPLWAGLTSCSCFVAGSLPSVIPFAFDTSPKLGFIYAAAFTVTALLVVGMLKTWATRGNFWRATMENLVISGGGGATAYGVGVLFDSIVRT